MFYFILFQVQQLQFSKCLSMSVSGGQMEDNSIDWIFLNISSRCSIVWRFGRDIWQHSLFYLFFSRRLAWHLCFVVIFFIYDLLHSSGWVLLIPWCTFTELFVIPWSERQHLRTSFHDVFSVWASLLNWVDRRELMQPVEDSWKAPNMFL